MEKKSGKFKLVKVSTKQFAALSEVKVENNEIELEAGISFSINEKSQIVSCLSSFKFLSNKTPFLIIDIICQFRIHPDAWNEYVDENKKTITLPKGLLQHLAVITIGTTRGVLHAKTENTPFNKYYLPSMNVTNIIKEDGVFKPEDK